MGISCVSELIGRTPSNEMCKNSFVFCSLQFGKNKRKGVYLQCCRVCYEQFGHVRVYLMNKRKGEKSVKAIVCIPYDNIVMMSPKTNDNDQGKLSNSIEVINGKGTNSLLSTFNRKRRHTFAVDLKVERVLSLPYPSGKFFFKIRLLNGGNHVYTCQERFEVHENKVEFNSSDHFPVKMTSRIDNFTLDHCWCRISIRKEGRGGRSYEKIGYYDLDLASVAGGGDESKACLLNGYQQTNSSPANAYLEIRMKLTIVEGDHIFRRPDNDHPYMKIDQIPSKKKSHEIFSDDSSSSTIIASAGELHPPLALNRGHSRQASKSSMCSNYSTTSINSSNPSNVNEKNPFKQKNDEETNQESQRRLNNQRRTPFVGQSGDIQRRLQSTRVDVSEIVNSVINSNATTEENGNGYLCLMYDEDGTAHVGSSSSCQSLQNPSSFFVSS